MILKKQLFIPANSSFCPIHTGVMGINMLYRSAIEANVISSPRLMRPGKRKSQRGWGLFFNLPWFLNFCNPLASKFKTNSEIPFFGLFMACLLNVLIFLLSRGNVTLGNCVHFGCSCGLSMILHMKEPTSAAFNSLYYH